MNKLTKQFINKELLLIKKRFVFKLRGSDNGISNSYLSKTNLSSNPVELVIQITKRLERQLDDMGIPQGRGIGERLSTFKGCSSISQNICTFVGIRNRMVHANGGWKNWFCKESFMNDYCKIENHLKSINEVLKRDQFEREYFIKTGGRTSRLEYAQQMLNEGNPQADCGNGTIVH